LPVTRGRELRKKRRRHGELLREGSRVFRVYPKGEEEKRRVKPRAIGEEKKKRTRGGGFKRGGKKKLIRSRANEMRSKLQCYNGAQNEEKR